MFERADLEQRFDLTTMAAHDLAATLWDNTTMRHRRASTWRSCTTDQL